VVGVLSVAGDADASIAPAFGVIGRFDPGSLTRDGSQSVPAEMRIADLLPEAATTFRYAGSLTTAPFTEGVAWIVFSEPRTASPDQIGAHDALVSARIPAYQDPPSNRPNPSGNARSLQDAAGREILTDLEF
jgi:carbonic anhydrase